MIQEELTETQKQLKQIRQLKQTKRRENQLLIPEEDLHHIIDQVLADSDPVKYLQNSQSLTHCITQMDCCGYTMIYYLGVESKFDSLLKIFTLSNLPLNSNICFFLLKSIIQIKSEGTYPIISKFLKDLRILENFNKQIEVFKNDQTIFNSLFLRSHFNLQQLWDLKLYKSIVKLFDLNHTIYMQQWVDHYAKQGKIPKNLKIKSSYMNKYNLFHQFLDLKKWEAFIQIFSEQQFEKDHFGSIPFTKFLRHSPQEFIQKYFNQFTNQLSQTLQKEQSEKKKNYFLHDLLQNQSLEDDFLVEFINQNGEDQRRIIYRNQYPIGTYLSVRREFQNQKIVKYLTIQTEDNTYFIQLVGAIQGFECKIDIAQNMRNQIPNYLNSLQLWRNNMLESYPHIIQIVQDHYYNNLQVARILFNNKQTNLNINYSMPLAYIPFELAQQSISFINLLLRRGFNEQAQFQLQHFLTCQHELSQQQEQFITQSINRAELGSIEKLEYQIKFSQLLSLLEEENMSIQFRSYVIEQLLEMIQEEELICQLLECYDICQKEKQLTNLVSVRVNQFKNNINQEEVESCGIDQKKLLFQIWPYLDIKLLEKIKQALIKFLQNPANFLLSNLLKICKNDNIQIWLFEVIFNNLQDRVENDGLIKYLKYYSFSQKVSEYLLSQDIGIYVKRKLIISYFFKFEDYNYQLLDEILPTLNLTIRIYKLIFTNFLKKQNLNGIYFFLRYFAQNNVKFKIGINKNTYKMINFTFAVNSHWSNCLSNQELIEFIKFHETQIKIPFTQNELLQAIVNICLNFQFTKLKTIMDWIIQLNEQERYQLFFSVLIKRLVHFENQVTNRYYQIFRIFPKPEQEPGQFLKALVDFKKTSYQPQSFTTSNGDLSHTTLFQSRNVEDQDFIKTLEFLEQFIDLPQMREQKELFLLYVYLKPSFDYDIMTPVNQELLLIDVVYLTVRKLGKCKLQQQYIDFIKSNKKYLKDFIELYQEDEQQKSLIKRLNQKYNYITKENEKFYRYSFQKSISCKIFRSYEKINNLIAQLKITNYQTYIQELYNWIKKQNSPISVIKEYDFLYFFTTHTTDHWIVELLKLIDISQITHQQLEYQGEPILSAIVFKKLYNTYKVLENKIAYQWTLKSQSLILQDNVIKRYDSAIQKYFNYTSIDMAQKALLNGFLVNLHVDNLSVYVSRTKQFLFPPDPYYLNSTAYQIYQELSKIIPKLNKTDLEILSLNLIKYTDTQSKDKMNQELFQEILLKSILEQKNYSPGSQQNDIMSQSAFSIQQILHSCKCKNNIVNLICELYNIVPTKSYPILHQIFSQFQVDLNTETLYSLCNHYEGIYHPFNKLLINKNLELFFNLETLGSLEYTCKIGLAMNQLEFEKNFMDLEIPNYSLYQINYQILLIIMMIRFDLNFEIKKQNIQLASCVKALNIIKQSQVNKVKYHHNNHFKKLESLLLEGDSKDYIIQFLIAQFSTLSPLEGYFEMIIYILKLDLQREDICNLVLAQSNFLLKYQPFQVNFGDQNKISEFTILCTINHNNQWFNHELDEYLIRKDMKFQIFIKQYQKKIMKFYIHESSKYRDLEFKSLSKAYYKDYIYQSKQLQQYWGAIRQDLIKKLKNRKFTKKTNILQKSQIIGNRTVKVIFDEQAKFTLETVLNFMKEFDPTNKTLLNEITINLTDIMCPSLFLCELVSIFDQFKFDITPMNYEQQFYLDARTLLETFSVFYKNCTSQFEFLGITRKLLYVPQFKTILQNVLLYIEQKQILNEDNSILITFNRIEKLIDSYQIENNQIENNFSIYFNKLFAFDQCECKLKDNQVTIIMHIGQPSNNYIQMEEYINNTTNIQGLQMIKDLTLLKQKKQSKKQQKRIWSLT